MYIEKRLLTVNPFSRPQTALKAVKGIVIHWIGNAGTDAEANRNYFENLKNQSSKDAVYASAHFVVGLSGNIIQCIPTSEMAYHVGANLYRNEAVKNLSVYPNNCTIGIELCHTDGRGRFTSETLRAATELACQLCKVNNLEPEKDLWRHFDVTGKICPKHFVDNIEEWHRFKSNAAAFAV